MSAPGEAARTARTRAPLAYAVQWFAFALAAVILYVIGSPQDGCDRSMTTPPESSRRSSRAQLWMLVAVFFAPLLDAFILYYGARRLAARRRQTNHGELIDPPARCCRAVQLTSEADAALAPDFLRGKWSLVYIGDGTCDARCRDSAHADAPDATRAERRSPARAARVSRDGTVLRSALARERAGRADRDRASRRPPVR